MIDLCKKKKKNQRMVLLSGLNCKRERSRVKIFRECAVGKPEMAFPSRNRQDRSDVSIRGMRVYKNPELLESFY